MTSSIVMGGSRWVRRTVVALALTAVVVGGWSGVGRAETEVTVASDVISAYVWRGITFNDELVMQPSINVAHDSGFGLNIWTNLDIGDFGGRLDGGTFSELDLTLSWALPIELVDVTVGNIFYKFPQADDVDTGEFFVSAGKSVVEGVSVTGAIYYDYAQVDGTYGTLGVSVDPGALGLKLHEKLGLSASANIGFASENFAVAYAGTDSGAFNWNIGGTATWQLCEPVSVKAFVTYTDNVDRDVLPEQTVDVFGGGGLTWVWG